MAYSFNRPFSSLLLVVALCAGPLVGQSLAQATFPADQATLGQIPDSVGEVGSDGPPLFVSIPVTGGVGGVATVSVSMTISHSWMGEITATLISPDGTSHVLFGRTLASSPGDIFWGTAHDLNGPFSFSDAASGNFWTAAGSSPVPPGAYRTSAIGGFVGATGDVTSMNPVFNNREPNGTWRVRFTDSAHLDVGIVSALSLTLTTTGVITPPTGVVPDSYIAGRSTPLVVAAPGVLGNDLNSAGSGALTATLQTSPTQGAVLLNSNGSFIYTPAPGYLGPDSFTYFASNDAPGSSASTTVSITVVPVQPPTQFRIDRVSGNLVTLRWDPPVVGPPPTGYLLEGGVAPGAPIASAVTGPTPTLTFVAPTGSFYLRAKALDGSMVSGVSNEVPVYVNVPVTPSAPISLTGLVDGTSLALSWKLSYGGGEPTNVILDVSGALVGSLPVGAVDTFTFAGVPPGTYTFAVRAANATGTSPASAPVTLTFPAACTGVPAPPRNYLFYGVGNVVNLLWDPPATGPAATAYVLNVTGSFTGSVAVGASRNPSGAVPPGTYAVSITALNACGASAPTAVRTVVVP